MNEDPKITLRKLSVAKIACTLAVAFVPATTALAQAPAPGGLGFGTEDPSVPSLVVGPGAMLGRTLHLTGYLPGAGAGTPVAIELQRRDGTWEQVAATAADERGRFDTTWKTNHIGRHTLRGRLADRPVAAATAAGAQAVARTTVFRPATATFFGPGFFGKQTACGQTLTKKLVGVAHRTLPCGTLVDLYYKGRVITAPVVDRGPFREGTSWDLTTAAAQQLNMTSTARIGAVRVRD